MKTKETKQTEAQERQKKYDALTLEQKIQRAGKKQKVKLLKKVNHSEKNN